MTLRIIRKIVAYLIVFYLTIVCIFVYFQRQLVFLPHKDGTLNPASFKAPYSDLYFPSKDGTKLHAWQLNHNDNTPHPVLLYCHGNGATLSQLAEVSSIFYRFGFDLFIFDYRSYGKSEGDSAELSEKSLHTDAQAAYDYLIAQGISETNLIVWGHSLGSSVAAWLTSKNHPAGVVLEGAFPSLYIMARERYSWLLIFPFMLFDIFDTKSYVEEIKAPILFIHAENDSIIPLKMGKLIYEAAHEPKKLLVIPEIDHNDFPEVIERYRDELMNLVKGWVSK